MNNKEHTKIKNDCCSSSSYFAWLFDKYDFSHDSWATVYQYDTALINKMQSVANGIEFTVNVPYYKMEMKLTDIGLFINVSKFPKIFCPDNGKVYGVKELINSHLKLWFTIDGSILMNMDVANARKTHWIPATIKTIYKRQGDNPLIIDFLRNFANAGNHKFLLDIMSDFDDGYYLCTISVVDSIKYHNRKEYVLNKYPNIQNIKMNYNKININLSYIIHKSIKYISDSDYGYLSQLKQLNFMTKNNYIRATASNLTTYFVTDYYMYFKGYKNFDIDKYRKLHGQRHDDFLFLLADNSNNESYMRTTIYDYISMAITDKRKISLRYSPKRLIEEHDYFMDNRPRTYYMKSMYRFQIPKNSKFNALNQLLPNEFEWIKTRTRLADESIMQHHCVWSYGKYIHNDECAIYSYVDTHGEYGEIGTRYTIEFRQRKSGKFYIAQMQKKYDRGGSQKLYNEINALLKST